MEKIVVKIARCDNKLMVSCNGVVVRKEEHDFNPLLTIAFDITAHLNPYPYENAVHFEGHNAVSGTPTAPKKGNSWHFWYQILRDGNVLVNVEEKSGSFWEETPGLKLSRTHLVQLTQTSQQVPTVS